ncbi:MAG: N-formylglutamate amidohydrolase [Gammaproteobacteria bacterium]
MPVNKVKANDDRPLLEPEEPSAFEIFNAAGASRLVVTCDHASPRIPRRLGTLGLPMHELERHIAWDIGAQAAARHLCACLDATLIVAGYSRLVVDLNRPLEARDAMATRSEETDIPGNRALSDDDRDRRATALYWPYHDAVHRLLRAKLDAGAVPVLLAMHSFTPVYLGERRPWHVGVLARADTRLADLVHDELSRDEALQVGINQPYFLELDKDYTIPVHAERRGLPNLELEIRHDLIDTERGALQWGERLSRVLQALVDHPAVQHPVAPATDVRAPRYDD